MNLRQSIAIGAVAILALTTACGNDDPSDPATDPSTTATATAPKPTGIASGEPVPALLDIAPGRLGRVHVGMSKKEALATGYFDADVKVGGDACPSVAPLQWKEHYKEQVDVFTDDDGTIAAMGVFATLTTDKGVGIGSTLGEVNDAYGDDVSPAQEAGFGQTGVFVTEGDKWLGFLVDESFAEVTPGSKVTFIEVTKGKKPDLIRDGC